MKTARIALGAAATLVAALPLVASADQVRAETPALSGHATKLSPAVGAQIKNRIGAGPRGQAFVDDNGPSWVEWKAEQKGADKFKSQVRPPVAAPNVRKSLKQFNR